MRVIRTEMYFEQPDVRGFGGYRRRPPSGPRSEEQQPGIAFAWFRTDAMIDRADIENIKAFRPLRPEQPDFPNRNQIRGLLDLFLRDGDEPEFLRIPRDDLLENPSIVDYLLDQEIVMEHSPPFSISLKGVLDSANTPIWIGTLVGFGAAPWDHPILLLLTVPGGIIAVSSARGIGRAMESGLQKAMKRLFDGR